MKKFVKDILSGMVENPTDAMVEECVKAMPYGVGVLVASYVIMVLIHIL